LLAFAILLVGALGSRPATAQTGRTANTPIEHFVVLMQQNHSFDNYFGAYPGAEGFPSGTCVPITVDDPSSSCVRPFHIGLLPARDLPHNAQTFARQFRQGRMDGFIDATRTQSRDYHPTMGYYDDRDIPYYWNLADNFVLFDRFFQSSKGGSVSNHLYWVAGTAIGDDSIPASGLPATLPTIFDRLSQAGVSWKFYIQDYDPAVNYRTLARAPEERRPQVSWAPLLAFDRFLDDPALNARIVDLSEYYADLERGTLPAVSYIVPAGSSEHPPGSIAAGETLVRSLVNSLTRSRYWDTSAFMWTYDGWGGWFDHVAPPQVDDAGYGFRVPALLVSAYAREGFVDSTELDFTSILRFIEDNWAIQPIATRDARANSLRQAFDFSTPPRPPTFISRSRTAPAQASPVGGMLAIYGAAVLGTAAVVAWSWRRGGAAPEAEPADA
jgi:phospholipase C